MHHDPRRITLLNRDPKIPDRDWDVSQNAPTHILIIDSFTVLRYALTSRVVDFDLDVERVILDRSTSPSEYLELLGELPPTFTGDVVLIVQTTGRSSARSRVAAIGSCTRSPRPICASIWKCTIS